jgi:hypothetical protein
MNLQAGLFLIHTAPVSFTSYSLVLGTGIFSITSEPLAFTTTTTFNLGTGVFTITGGNLGIYGACSSGTVIDTLAADAPYPPADFFVPETQSAPSVVLSPDEVFGTSTTDPNSQIYLTYYNTDTQIWDDTAYETQFPGEVIPLGLKQDVADQTYLYNQYIVALALWQSEYDRQRIFQWPYYWAHNVAIAPGSTPGGIQDCDCGNCGIVLSPDTIPPANQTVFGGTGVSIDDKFDIGGTQYTVGQMFAMVISKLAQP